ncbi:MAG: stressosome-associated protein Prli42 [bacterium]|nr:stressosome-associated protein Prli42 [bacterium]
MSKKAQKIVVWTMLIVMVAGIVASYAAMFISR